MVSQVQFEGNIYDIPSNGLIKLLRDTMTSIQRGRIVRGDWSYVIPEWDGPAHEHDVDGQKVLSA